MTWIITAWKYRKYIGLVLALAAAFTTYNIVTQSHFKKGYQYCTLENEKIIAEIKLQNEKMIADRKKASANEIVKVRNKFEKFYVGIDDAVDSGAIMPVSTNTIKRLYNDEGDSGK